MKMNNWQGKKVLILGAARQGVATLKYLLENGAALTVNDIKPAVEFKELMQQFETQNVNWVFGSHPLTLIEKIDFVVVSGGVPLSLPILSEAIQRGIPLTNDSQIFMESVKAKVIGITGSAGKTTTTTLVGEIARRSVHGDQKAWIGGNIGFPLIDHLKEIKATDLVVTELSSFQLELMTISPMIVAILNITPNHLDRHENMEAYIKAKSRILQFQTKNDTAILNCDDATVMSLENLVQGKFITFGRHSFKRNAGAYLADNQLVFMENGKEVKLLTSSEVGLKGEHNLMNALAACAISMAADYPPDAIRDGIKNVTSVPHRLEWIREWRGTNWYNDSIATAPERTMAAIRSFDQPILLLLGGRDKKLPWDDLTELIHQKVKKLIIFGEAGELISKAIGKPTANEYPRFIALCEKFDEAVRKAAEIAEKGDTILLSPGCTSFDEFRDFEERGNRFIQLVKELPQ
jgi:UDP-N-acetylmuramoylalanine--D-glutamate ligase